MRIGLWGNEQYWQIVAKERGAHGTTWGGGRGIWAFLAHESYQRAPHLDWPLSDFTLTQKKTIDCDWRGSDRLSDRAVLLSQNPAGKSI